MSPQGGVHPATRSKTGRNVDRVAFFKRHIRLFDVLTLAQLTTEALDFALRDGRVHSFYLHTKQRLNGLFDHRFVAVHRHLENNRAVLGRHGGFFGDDRLADHVVMFCLGTHFSRASSASMPAFVITRVSRLRISYTFAPIDGRMSKPSMLRDAARKSAFTEAPSMTNARFQPRSLTCLARAPVLPDVDASSITTSSPAAILADKACLRPSLRNFLVRSWPCERTTGPL
mmetsp:Transcript_22413/g.36076  ORF Transcript_22413/g.36076 Transcript_22413/m.36076 type:complete len:229 (+) Transcript_22413:1705-2391(+)